MDEGSSSLRPADLSKIKAYSISCRASKVSVNNFAKAVDEEATIGQFFSSLPKILAGQEFICLLQAMAKAHLSKRPICMAIGAHVVKVGLGPIIVDLMQKGVVNALAMTGATALHDLEVAMMGATSEEVEEGLKDGSFGMAEETAQAFAKACERGAKEAIGLGRALGLHILESHYPFASHSLLAWAARLKLPLTVHVALGTDVVHMHPCVQPGPLAEASHLDFRLLISLVSQLEGGVWLNIGSAVVLPEVFLKALSAARNMGAKVETFTTANLDMLQHYRPRRNVVERPTTTSGKGYLLTGHHELMLPLLRLGVLWAIKEAKREDVPQAP